MSGRKAVKVATVVQGGPILEILRDTFLLIGSVSSTFLDHLLAIREDAARQTALMERIAEVVAPTVEQRRMARMTLAGEAAAFEPDLDDETDTSSDRNAAVA